MAIAIISITNKIKTDYVNVRQEIVFDCLGTHIKQVNNISYVYYKIKELHKFTKDDRFLDKIYIKNYGNSLFKFYETSKYVLPDYINNLIEFEPKN